MEEPSQKPHKQKPKRQLNDYVKYSQLAFQMIAVMVFTVFAGVKLDQWTGWEFPVFTIVLSLAGVGTAIYMTIKSFL